MNSVTVDFGGHAGGGLPRWLDAIRLSADRNLRRLIGFVYVAMALATGLLWLGTDKFNATGVLATLSIGTFFAWAFWFPRALLLQMAAREARIPALERDALRGLLLAAVVSVLLPGAVLSGFGVDPVLALGTLVAVALGGLLFALLPRGCAGLLGFGPLLSDRLHLATWLGPLGVHVWLPALVAVLALLAGWRWRVVKAGGSGQDEGTWRQPMVFFQGQAGALAAWRRMGEQQQSARPRWLRKYAVDAGPATPVRAMRTWLGGSFAPLRASSRLLEGLLMAGFLLAFPWLMAATSTHDHRLGFAAMVWGGIFALTMLAMSFGPRLQVLRRRHNGEFAELALLPGWGGPGQARATLLRAVAVPMAVLAGLSAALLMVSAGFVGIGAEGGLLLAAAWSGGLLMGVVACLQPLSGRDLDWRWGLAFILLGMPLLSGTVMFAAWEQRHPVAANGMLAMFAAWVVLDAMLVLLVIRGWRRMQAMPQPFLQR